MPPWPVTSGLGDFIKENLPPSFLYSYSCPLESVAPPLVATGHPHDRLSWITLKESMEKYFLHMLLRLLQLKRWLLLTVFGLHAFD